jgi:hypothetical protein
VGVKCAVAYDDGTDTVFRNVGYEKAEFVTVVLLKIHDFSKLYAVLTGKN